MNILEIIKNGYTSYASYLWHEITHPAWNNYFYWLILVSMFFFMLEVIVPWRKKQPVVRRGFWLDGFYMFFNFFLFSLIIYNAASDVVVQFFNGIITSITSIDIQASNPMRYWPVWAILLTGFVARDFVQWWVHRLLHKVDWLWKFHAVHHSVKEMGFAAHLRYHWVENIVYRSIEYIPLALLGIGLHDFFVIHIFTLAVGHYNHSNITVEGKVTAGILGVLCVIISWFGLADITFMTDLSVLYKIALSALILCAFVFGLGIFMKRLFNSPEMHIWHHAYHLPSARTTGVNFGITLSIWDYIFKTDYIPSDGRDIELGFPGVDNVPESFVGQAVYGFNR